MTTIKDHYSADDAMRLCGFRSVAMIDYLQRSGVFVPKKRGEARRGKGRRFEFRDLLVLKAIKRLLDSGASVATLKKSLYEFQRLNWIADPATLEDKSGIVKFLIVSNGEIYLKRDASILIELSSSGQLAFSFIIDLEILHSELREGLGLPKPQWELDL